MINGSCCAVLESAFIICKQPFLTFPPHTNRDANHFIKKSLRCLRAPTNDVVVLVAVLLLLSDHVFRLVACSANNTLLNKLTCAAFRAFEQRCCWW